jgi:hypothetical protein
MQIQHKHSDFSQHLLRPKYQTSSSANFVQPLYEYSMHSSVYFAVYSACKPLKANRVLVITVN